MEIIDSLQSVFDKKIAEFFCVKDDWEIVETNPKASFIKLTFHKANATFGIIVDSFYKGFGTISSRSKYLLDSNCDGVSFCEDEDTTRLILVDMKSSFNETNIEGAYRQDFFTFLKMHMILNFCEGYQLNSLMIDFYAACPPCESKNEEADILDNILQTEEAGENRFINNCIKSYLYGYNNYSCQIKELPYVKDKKLHSDILSTTVSFHIFTPEHFTDKEGVLNL
jgi:hypothetical protein